MTQIIKNFTIIVLVLLVSTNNFAQTSDSLKFSPIKEIKITPVKNQASSGTCWCYSTMSYFEAELIRTGKKEIRLSEMFVVHHSYIDKADKYVRTHGKVNFSAGGGFYDVLHVWKNYGIVPLEIMIGLNYGEEANKHGELDALTKSFVNTIITNPNKKLTTVWKNAFKGIVDAYLGEIPRQFIYNGKQYTPLSFSKELGLNMDDYVSLTSFTHHPFYSKFILEIPDNWRWSESYNLPLNEFVQIFDHAINNGYTIAWAADVSERGFTRNGLGFNPETSRTNLPGSDQARWLNYSNKELEDLLYNKQLTTIEKKVTQALRQEDFDNYNTTDDHAMLIYGIANDQNGKKYYMVKNSWGTNNRYNGIWYVTESYVQHKTMNILINKNAIPKDVRKKLNL